MFASSIESVSTAPVERVDSSSEPTGEPASVDELAGTVESVLRNHAELDDTVRGLRDLCAALSGNRASCDSAPAALIAEFEAQLVAHFDVEQAEELFGSLVTHQPHLFKRVEHLQAAHGEMAEALDQLLTFARKGPPGRDLAARLTRFLDRFDAHEHAENALMQEFLLLDQAARHRRQRRVEEIMNSSVSACSPSDTLERVAEVMAERGCDLVVVLDESRHLLGTITDRDLWMSAYRESAPLTAIVASAAMSQGSVTCLPNEEVSAAGRRIQGHAGIRCAAVVNERGEFMGVVTLGRIAACRDMSM
jgi:CBS domain-containing protein